MSTPALHLRTLLVLDDQGRSVSTREPGGIPGPLFTVIRGATSCAWAVRADVPDELARALDRLAGDEPPSDDLRAAPVHAERYLSLLADRIDRPPPTKLDQSDGLAFAFPEALPSPDAVVPVADEALLERHFRGWVKGEIAAGRAPALAIVEDRHPVSVCFCARRSPLAAEAGLETAEAYRGRGYAAQVTAAWAMAIRQAGLIPLYSTSWTNPASLAVARKLGLTAYASAWGLAADLRPAPPPVGPG